MMCFIIALHLPHKPMINYAQAHRMCVYVCERSGARASAMFVKSLCVSAENPSKSLNEQSNQKTHASKCRPQLLWYAVKRWKLRLLLMSSTTCIVCFSILMRQHCLSLIIFKPAPIHSRTLLLSFVRSPKITMVAANVFQSH